jgi:hypothetical protein
MAYVRKLPAGTVGWTGSTMQENQQEDVFMPCDTRLVAVNVGPDGTFGTLVYDTNQANEYDRDRSAWLQSAFRVIKKPLGKPNSIGFQLYLSGNKDTKGGFFVDKGDGGTARPNTATGGKAIGGSNMVATGGHSAAGGAHGAAPENAGIHEENVGKSGGVIIGQGSFNDGGPFHVGNKSDKHNKGTDADGNPINALHLWTGANFYRNQAHDGPLRFETVYKKGQDQKIIVPVHLGWTGVDWAWWSTSYFYQPPGETRPNPPPYTTPGNTIRPSVTTPGNTTIRPNVTTPGGSTIRPGVATPGHGPGGVIIPGDPPPGPEVVTGGGTSGTPVTPGTTGGNTGPGPGVPTPGGGSGGTGQPVGGTIPPYTGEPGEDGGPPLEGPADPSGGPIDDPSAGPQGGLFGPIDPYAPPKPPNFDLPFDPTAPVFYNIIGTSVSGPTFNMISSVGAIVSNAGIFQAVNYSPGMVDPGIFGAASAAALGKQATTSPLTGGMSSFAAQGGTIAGGPPSPTPPPSPAIPTGPPYPTPPPSPVPTPTPSWPPPVAPPSPNPSPPASPPTTTGGGGDPWDYTASPAEQTLGNLPKSKYQSGTADGGIVYHPIETDLRDVASGMIPDGVALNDFYVICAPNAYFGVGVPNLVNGSIQSGYRWNMDTATGDLVFSSISFSQNPIEAVRFTNSSQTIQWKNGMYRYGELYHQNKTNRRYTFPDATGNVLVFGTTAYASGTQVTLTGQLTGGPANPTVFRWMPTVDPQSNLTVYIPLFV